jgi:hypothetical protein
MTNINLDLATKLDGSESHMTAILVDSWADKLVILLNCEMKIAPADYFIPCAHCGNAVLECNFQANMDTCDRCNAGHTSGFKPTTMYQYTSGMRKRVIEDIVPKLETLIQPNVIGKCGYCNQDLLEGAFYTRVDGIPYHEQCNTIRTSVMLNMTLTQTLPEDIKMTNTKSDLGERIAMALDHAETAFWNVIAKAFPEAKEGDLDPMMTNMLQETMNKAVEMWCQNNIPKQSHSGHVIEDLHLHYKGEWHLCHTGGGCMVAVTDNVAIAGEYRYLAVSSDCVAVYVDDFTGENFLQDHLFDWAFGDNPTVLMNYLNDYLGNECLFDMNKLFDDIITIGKSDRV